MDLAGFTALEGLLISAVIALTGSIAWGSTKLFKAFTKNTEAFTELNTTFGEIRMEQRQHREVDLAIRDNLTAIRTILAERKPE